VHKAITIYHSSTEIFTEIKVKQNFSQQLADKNVLLFSFVSTSALVRRVILKIDVLLKT